MQSSKSKEILGNAMLEIDEKGKKKKKELAVLKWNLRNTQESLATRKNPERILRRFHPILPQRIGISFQARINP